MVLESKKTTVAYRCPHCGAGVMSLVDIFSLGADMLKLKCTCGESEMTMVKGRDGKVRFTVPCFLCPNPHMFTVSSSMVFGRELFVLPCPYSDINIAMMGDTEHVKAELSRSELSLLEMLEKSGLSSTDALRGEQILSDPQVLEIVTYVIREMDEEGRIRCRCEGEGEREYDAEILEGAVRVTCRACGASCEIPTDSLIRAEAFLNADHLDLE